MILTVFNIVYVLVAIAMIVLILLQRGAGAQAGSGFGGGASGTVFGARGAATFLSRSTAILAALFFLLSLAMAWYLDHGYLTRPADDLGVMSGVDATPALAKPAVAPTTSTGDVPAAPAATAPTTTSDVPNASPSIALPTTSSSTNNVLGAPASGAPPVPATVAAPAIVPAQPQSENASAPSSAPPAAAAEKAHAQEHPAKSGNKKH